MKLRTLLLTASLTLSIGLTSAIVPAQASSWHKGSPKVMQGNWKWGNEHTKAPHGGWAYMTVTNSKGVMGTEGEHGIFYKYNKYKYLGHGKYLINESYYVGYNAKIGHDSQKVQLLDHNKKMNTGLSLDKHHNIIYSKTNKKQFDMKGWSMTN